MARKINIPTEKITSFLKQVPVRLKQLPPRIMPFLKSVPQRIKGFPSVFQQAPIDEKIAYCVVGAGVLFILMGLLL